MPKIKEIDLKIDMQIDLAKIVMALVVLILILGGYMRADDLIKIEKDKVAAQLELTRVQTECECPKCPEPFVIENWPNVTYYPPYWYYVKGG